MAWRLWLRGLFAATIAAAANGVAVVIVDPKTFDPFHGGGIYLARVCAVFAAVGAALYLKKHPDPWKENDA